MAKLIILLAPITTVFATLPAIARAGLQVILLHLAYASLSLALFGVALFGARGLNLIGGSLFGAWWLFNTMGLTRVAAVLDFDQTDIVLGYLLVLGATAALMLGYAVGSRFRTRAVLFSARVVHPGTSQAVLPAIMFPAIALLAWQLWAAGGVTEYITRPYGSKLPTSVVNIAFVLNRIVSDGAYFASCAALMDSSLGWFSKVMAAGYAALYYLFTVWSGRSGAALMLILVPAIFLIAPDYKKTLGPRHFAPITAVFLLAVLVAGLVRQCRSDPGAVFGEGMQAALSAIRPDRLLDFLLYSHTFDLLENTLRIIRYYPAGIGGGTQFAYPLVNLVPRAVFPAKPEGLGALIVRDIYGAPPGTSISFAPGVIGEFYYDFGYLGVFLGLAFCGLVVGLMQGRLRLGVQSHPYGTALVTQFAVSLTSFPNSYTGAAIRLGFSLVFWVLVWLVSVTLRTIQSRAHPFWGRK